MSRPGKYRWTAAPLQGWAGARLAHRLFTVSFLLLALHCSSAPTHAQVSKEYQIKAVLLFRLAQFVDWPTNRFDAPESPVVIGVLGRNPFGDALTVAVDGETAQNRRIEVLPLQPGQESRDCHLVFISRSEESKVREITSALSGRSVLTVSDMEGFASTGGGMIQFVTEQNKVNLRIDAEAAKAAGLVLNSRLLRMAEIVKRP